MRMNRWYYRNDGIEVCDGNNGSKRSMVVVVMRARSYDSLSVNSNNNNYNNNYINNNNNNKCNTKTMNK